MIDMREVPTRVRDQHEREVDMINMRERIDMSDDRHDRHEIEGRHDQHERGSTRERIDMM